MANSVTSQLPIPIPLLSARDILARLGNQASRPPLRSPPVITPAKLADSLQPQRSAQSAKNAMANALARGITHLEIQALYDDRDSNRPQLLAGLPLYLVVPFNPETLEHSIKANWAELTSPGLPYKRLHYFGTENQTFKFDLLLDYMQILDIGRAPTGRAPGEVGVLDKAGTPQKPVQRNNPIDGPTNFVADAYKFLQSLLYPKGGVEGPASLHPPEVLLFWPNALSLHCVLWEMSAKWQKMLPTGHLASVMVSLTFKEIPPARKFNEPPQSVLTFEEVRSKGTMRAAGRALSGF